MTSTCQCTRCAAEEHSRLSMEIQQSGEWAEPGEACCPARGDHVACARRVGHVNPEHGDGRGTLWRDHVVVGGRYVVGDGPTFHEEDGSTGSLGRWIVGETVTVIGGPDSDGDVQVMASNRCQRWIDPRHLMPAPDQPAEPSPGVKRHADAITKTAMPPSMPWDDKPAEAPAIDDDLCCDIGHWLNQFDRNVSIAYADDGQAFVESEVGQRLRAAWTAQVEWERARDREDAQSEHAAAWQTARQLERERDEARAEVSSTKLALSEVREELSDAQANVAALADDLDRLRAAQPELPDVDITAFWMEDGTVRDEQRNITWNHRDQAAEFAASALHALTVFDVEAAGAGATTDDEEQDAPDLDAAVAALHDKFGHPSRNLMWADIIRALDAHRDAKMRASMSDFDIIDTDPLP